MKQYLFRCVVLLLGFLIFSDFAAARLKPSRLARTVYDAILHEGFERSTVPPSLIITDKNHVMNFMVDGREIYETYRDSISKAHEEVVLATFDWSNEASDWWPRDPSGNRVQTDAIKTLGEGFLVATSHLGPGKKLKLNILLEKDDSKRAISTDPLEEVTLSLMKWRQMEVDLSRMDVVVSLYAHLGFGAMHNKYLVVDRSETSITGSNIQVYSNYNAWNWHDFGLRMCGPVARQALASFQHFYTKSKNYRLVVEKRDERLLWQPIQAEKLSNHERGDQDHDPLPVCTNEGKTRILALTQDAWQVPVFAPSSPQTVGWKAVMRNAKKMIHIASPNIGSSEFIEEIVKSAVRGVKVKILSSKDFNDWAYSTLTARLIGFGNTNQKAVQLIRSKIEAEAIRLNDLSLLKNIEIRWYSGDGIRHAQGNGAYACHAKVMVADSRIVIAGSGNHDKLSWNYASEFNLLLDDKQLAEQINWRVFDLDWNRSFEQTFNQD